MTNENNAAGETLPNEKLECPVCGAQNAFTIDPDNDANGHCSVEGVTWVVRPTLRFRKIVDNNKIAGETLPMICNACHKSAIDLTGTPIEGFFVCCYCRDALGLSGCGNPAWGVGIRTSQSGDIIDDDDDTDYTDELITENERLRRSNEFYLERMNALQELQKTIPEPYRTCVCDILANGYLGIHTKEALRTSEQGAVEES